MKNTKIKLNSKSLKPGDKIIRTQPLTESNHAYSTIPVKVIRKRPYHIEVQYQFQEATGNTDILNYVTWNDGNWARWID